MKLSLGSASFCALVLLLACGGESFTTDGGGADEGDSDNDGSGGSSADGTSDSGGSTSSGGSSSAGGSGSGGAIGGSPGSGGAGPTCQDEPLEFHLELAKPGSHCTPLCGSSFLKISDKFGKEVDFEFGCRVDCETCGGGICPALGICALQTVVTEPLHHSWSGTNYLPNTCGEAMSSCSESSCAKPGEYVAQFCLPRASDEASEPVDACPENAEVTCVKVDFNWPRTEPVVATLE